MFHIESGFNNEYARDIEGNPTVTELGLPIEEDFLNKLQECDWICIVFNGSDVPNKAFVSLCPDHPRNLARGDECYLYKNAITFYATKEELIDLKNAIEATILVM